MKFQGLPRLRFIRLLFSAYYVAHFFTLLFQLLQPSLDFIFFHWKFTKYLEIHFSCLKTETKFKLSSKTATHFVELKCWCWSQAGWILHPDKTTQYSSTTYFNASAGGVGSRWNCLDKLHIIFFIVVLYHFRLERRSHFVISPWLTRQSRRQRESHFDQRGYSWVALEGTCYQVRPICSFDFAFTPNLRRWCPFSGVCPLFTILTSNLTLLRFCLAKRMTQQNGGGITQFSMSYVRLIFTYFFSDTQYIIWTGGFCQTSLRYYLVS